MDLFETLGQALNPKEAKIQALNAELTVINKKIESIEGRTDYTDRVAASFPLGMVGGSGKNTAYLNRKREQSIEKTVVNAVIACKLYKEREAIKAKIKDIENDGEAKRAAQKEKNIHSLVQYWVSIKKGDTIDIGGNAPVIVTKKNAKSLETGSGCKWTAAEIIGKEAAKIL